MTTNRRSAATQARRLQQLEQLHDEAAEHQVAIEKIRVRRDKIILALVAVTPEAGRVGATTIARAAGLTTTAIYHIRNRARDKDSTE
jgi:hypothetical protein